MDQWVPATDFIAADVVRWTEGIYDRRKRGKALRIGERLVAAEVIERGKDEVVGLLFQQVSPLFTLTVNECVDLGALCGVNPAGVWSDCDWRLVGIRCSNWPRFKAAPCRSVLRSVILVFLDLRSGFAGRLLMAGVCAQGASDRYPVALSIINWHIRDR